MSLVLLKAKFNSLLKSINGSSTTNFATTVETGYEAVVLATVMAEYKKVYGAISSLTPPASSSFLNQKPGKFRISRAFKIDFQSGVGFYFAADIEVYGLEAFVHSKPVGTLFEVDVVVIPEQFVNDVVNNFAGYPAPQHIDSAYECKFGKYNKGQLRELLGLKRHLCYLNKSTISKPILFSTPVLNSNPSIAIKMARPRVHKFFAKSTALFYELEQIIIR